MPENFEQMVAKIIIFFPLIFRVLLGTTKLIIAFSKKTSLIVRKTEKYICTAGGLK